MTILPSSKRCSKCRRRQPLGDFHRDATKSDGHNPRCKLCVKKYCAKNAKKLRQYSIEWRTTNPERYAEYQREWQKKRNRERPKVYKPRPITQHRREMNRRYSMESYYRRPGLSAQKRAQRRKHVEAAGGRFTKLEWQTLKARYGHTCLCCDRVEPDIKLTPDHVIPVSRGGSNTIDNIQPLCLECNLRKSAKTIDYRSRA